MTMPRNPFTITSDREKAAIRDSRIVGAAVPQQLVEDLTLFALYKNQYKSDLIREAIYTFMKRLSWSKLEAIRALIIRAQKEWDRRKEENEGKEFWSIPDAFQSYRHEIYSKLLSRGIMPKTAKKIVEGVRR